MPDMANYDNEKREGDSVKKANLADWLESRIHHDFTTLADNLFGEGILTREERIGLSGLIGDALDVFHEGLQGDTFADLHERRQWEEAPEKGAGDGKSADAPTGDGMAVKFLREEGGGAIVGGYIAPWGSEKKKDLQDDYFTPETKTWTEIYKSAPALFHHGLDDTIGLAVIGHRVKAEPDEIGLWVEDWLDVSSEYWRMVEPLLEAKALYYSPGSAPHLVRREEDGRLLSYPIVEDTLTVTPAQHRLRPIEQIKAAYKAAGLDFPSEADEAEATGGRRAEEETLARLRAENDNAIALIDLTMED